jgi:molybdopterin biosynthesis enzyme
VGSSDASCVGALDEPQILLLPRSPSSSRLKNTIIAEPILCSLMRRAHSTQTATAPALSSAPAEPGTESTTIKSLTILFRERKRAHLREGSQLLSGGILKEVENGFATLPHTRSQSPPS